MIKLIVLSVLLNAGEMVALPPEDTQKIQASRKRGKDNRGRRRGGSGLRQDGKKRERYDGGNVSRMAI